MALNLRSFADFYYELFQDDKPPTLEDKAWIMSLAFTISMLSMSMFILSYKLLDFIKPWCIKVLQHKLNGSIKNWFKFKNIFLSFVHSIVSSVIVLICIINKPILFTNIIDEVESLAFTLFSIMAGYFISDTLLNIVHRKDYNKSIFQCLEITVHHLICVIAFIIATFEMRFIGAILIVVLAEIHNMFLHLRSLILLLHLNSIYRCIFKTIVFLNLATLIIFRTLPSIYIIYKFYFISTSAEQIISVEVLILIWVSICILFLFKTFIIRRLIVSDLIVN